MKRTIFLLVLAAAGCATDSHSPGTGSGSDPGPGSGSDPGSDPGMTNGTLTAFVVDLVTHQTSDRTEPVAFDRFEALPDPDAATNNTSAYAGLF